MGHAGVNRRCYSKNENVTNRSTYHTLRIRNCREKRIDRSLSEGYTSSKMCEKWIGPRGPSQGVLDVSYVCEAIFLISCMLVSRNTKKYITNVYVNPQVERHSGIGYVSLPLQLVNWISWILEHIISPYTSVVSWAMGLLRSSALKGTPPPPFADLTFFFLLGDWWMVTSGHVWYLYINLSFYLFMSDISWKLYSSNMYISWSIYTYRLIWWYIQMLIPVAIPPSMQHPSAWSSLDLKTSVGCHGGAASFHHRGVYRWGWNYPYQKANEVPGRSLLTC